MEEMIELWQQASLEESGTEHLIQKDELIPMIIRLEKKQQYLLRLKTLSVLILLPAIIILFMNLSVLTPVAVLGIFIFMISVLVVVLMLNRLHFHIADRERELTTLQLAGIAEHKILIEKKLFTIYLPLFVVVALTGFNLMFLEYFAGEEPSTRVLYHMVMTGSLVVAFVMGLSVRIRRFKKQFLPVLDRIRKFRSEAGVGKNERDGDPVL